MFSPTLNCKSVVCFSLLGDRTGHPPTPTPRTDSGLFNDSRVPTCDVVGQTEIQRMSEAGGGGWVCSVWSPSGSIRQVTGGFRQGMPPNVRTRLLAGRPAVFARSRRLRKSPSYLLVNLHGKMTVSANQISAKFPQQLRRQVSTSWLTQFPSPAPLPPRPRYHYSYDWYQ